MVKRKTEYMKKQIREGVWHLKRQGYFAVKAQQSDFAQTIQSFFPYVKEFFAQPMEQKTRHEVSPDGYGYEYRGPENPNEYKETLHVGLGYKLPAGASDADRRLVVFSQLLMQSLLSTVGHVAQVISAASHKDLVEFLMGSLSTATLRILYYPPDLPGMKREFLATEHVDKGFTIHPGETCPGLQVDWNGGWIDVAEVPGSVYGYAGLLGQFYTECGLTALRHRVVPTEISRTIGRYALVIFLDPGEYRYDKRVWGPTQATFGKGENYGMPFAEFKKYFALKEIAPAM